MKLSEELNLGFIKIMVSNNNAANFLVCVDDSSDFKVALNFACNQAKNSSGTLTLLYVIELADFRHWKNVESIMNEESKVNAEELLEQLRDNIKKQYGLDSFLLVREGEKVEEIIKVINSDSSLKIDNLVLGVAIEGQGSNRLVNALTGALTKNLKIPVTIVPENVEIKR